MLDYRKIDLVRNILHLESSEIGFFQDLLRQARTRKYFKKSYASQFAPDTCHNPTELNNSNNDPLPLTLWQFWHRDLDEAPEIIKRCHHSVQQYCDLDKIVLLNLKTIADHVAIPGYIYDKLDLGIISLAHFSDILRANLLAQRGGVWLDATVYLTDKIPQRLIQKRLFAFSTPPVELLGSPYIKASNWFIASRSDSVLLRKLSAFLVEFWKSERSVPHYYIFHLAFCLLIDTCPLCREEWSQVEFMTQINPHLLQLHLGSPFDAEMMEIIKAQSFIHKLTYYGFPDRKTAGNTFLDHLIREVI